MISAAPRRRLRISLVETVFPGRRDVFGNMRLSLLSGDLKAAGHRVRIFAVDSTAAGSSAALLRRFLADDFVRRSDMTVFYRSWPTALADGLREAHPRMHLCLYESGRPFGVPAESKILGAGRASVLREARRISGGRPLLSRAEHALYVPAGLPFRPDLKRVAISAERPFDPGTGIPELLGRLDCPYRRSTRNNAFFDGLDLKGKVAFSGGCSICLFRTSGAGPVGAEEWVSSLVRQLRWFRSSRCRSRIFRLGDHAPLEFLGALLERLRRDDLRGLSFLLDARVDQLLSRRIRWNELFAQARRAGARLEFLCVGFENFSQPELDRFNKGTKVAQNVEAIRLLRRLAADAPDVFSHGHSAAGFITFTPWTTPDDLRANLRAFRALDFGRFRSDLARARLRLYPEMPLYHAASRDGLLLERPPAGWAQATGYALDHPWRFRSEETAAIHAVTGRLLRQAHARGGEIDLLEAAVKACGRRG